MKDWIKSVIKGPEPSGPPQTLRSFDVSEPTIDTDCVNVDGDAWLVRSPGEEPVRLFEVQDPDVECCMLTYRASMKTEELTKRAYLEMWCRFPGRGEFFSKGFDHAVKGTNDWASYQTPFYLKTEQKPDLIKLNVTIEGEGKVWIKDLELSVTPL